MTNPKPRKKLSALAAFAAGGAVLTTSFVGIAPANAVEIDTTFTNVSIDKTGDINKDGILQLRERLNFNFDFTIPDDAKAGDTFKVTMPNYYPLFSDTLEIKDEDGTVLATATDAEGQYDRYFTITVAEGAESKIGVTGSASIPFTLNTTTPKHEDRAVTYQINKGEIIDTGESFKTAIPGVYSTNPLIYTQANANGTVELSPVGVVGVSKETRDVTMTFTTTSDNWKFKPGEYTIESEIDKSPSVDEIEGGGVIWETPWEENTEIVSESEDEIVLLLKNVPADYAARVQLNAAGSGYIDGNDYLMDYTVTSAGSSRGDGRILSTSIPPTGISGLAEGEAIAPSVTLESYINDQDADTENDAIKLQAPNQNGTAEGTIKLEITNTGNVPLINPTITGTLPNGDEYTQTLEGLSIPVGETHTETLETQNFPTGKYASDWTVTANGQTATDPTNANVSFPATPLEPGITYTAPTAEPDTATTQKGQEINIDVLENDETTFEGATIDKVELKDAEDNPVTELVTDEGTFTVNEDNTVTFTPVDDFTGTVPTVEYIVTDSNGQSAESTIDVTVNDNPVANPDEGSTKPGEAVTISPLENDELPEGAEWEKVELLDPEGNPVTELEVEEGTFVVNDDNTVTFTPVDGFEGEVPEVPYRATDSNGGTADSTIKVTVTPAEEEVPAPPVEEPTEEPAAPVEDDPAQEPKPGEPKPEAPAEEPETPSINTGGDPTQTSSALGGVLGGLLAAAGAAGFKLRQRFNNN